MKKITIALPVVCLLLAGLAIGVIFLYTEKPTQAILDSHIVTEPKSRPTLAPQAYYGTPVRIDINKLNVHTLVEPVGTDSKGNMDVPKDVNNVAWYNLGYYPGEAGNAVVADHLDSANGPAIFAKLATLIPGDTITITTNTNKHYVYKVSGKAVYPYDKMPIDQVFGTSSMAQLNLITCSGTFIRTKKTYSNRIVVFSQLTQLQN